jgi:hypothetical protein
MGGPRLYVLGEQWLQMQGRWARVSKKSDSSATSVVGSSDKTQDEDWGENEG